MEVAGVRDAIRALNKVEPGLRKEFTAEAKRIADPVIAHVQESYTALPLSGMAFHDSLLDSFIAYRQRMRHSFIKVAFYLLFSPVISLGNLQFILVISIGHLMSGIQICRVG